MNTMYDAVTATNIPSNAEYVACYIDGNFANEAAIRAHCPDAKGVLTITVWGHPADCCDCEAGDLTITQAIQWVGERLAAGAHRPCVYADADYWNNQGLGNALAHYGDRIRRWVAQYDGVAEIPSGFDAKQYRSTDVDTSVIADDFFGQPQPVKPDQYPGTPVKYGDRGVYVREVQQRLVSAHHWKLTVDGVFGGHTLGAVQVFQRNHQLTADGIVGPKTWAKLF